MKPLPYEVFIRQNIKGALYVNLDAPNPTALPPVVRAGLGNKLKRYKDFLNSSFEKNQYLLKYLIFIHREAKKVGKVSFNTTKAYPKEYVEVLTAWLQEQQETLDMLTPYFFNTEAPTASNDVEKEQQETSEDSVNKSNFMSFNNGNHVQLTPEEKKHIWDQIKDDFIETRKENNPC